MDSRRSTAAQFFLEEEQTEKFTSTQDKIVELINQATLMTASQPKVNSLKQVQELIIHKEPDLLDNFLDEMLAFQHDKSIDVRVFVVSFIEEACKKDQDIFPQVIENFSMMLEDENVSVVKRVIQSATQLYRVALAWCCRAKMVTELMESTWVCLNDLKDRIVALLNSDNDGVRTQTVKFMESLVTVQSYPEPNKPKKGENDVSLDDIPNGHKFLKLRKLEEEGKKVFEMLIQFHGSPCVTSVNLMACMGSLTTIVKNRSEFAHKVIEAFEALHGNMPPTLAKSQVSSVRKHLKLQLLSLVKLPSTAEFHSRMSTLLLDLGASEQEVLKILPKPEDLKKRARPEEASAHVAKRLKLEALDDQGSSKETEEAKSVKLSTSMAIDITTNHFVPKLVNENVVDIVLLSMVNLPDVMPPNFQSNYTPIAAAGTTTQIEHMARLLATQITAAEMGPGFDEMKQKAVDLDEDKSQKLTLSSIKKEDSQLPALPTVSQTKLAKRQTVRNVSLKEITKPLVPAKSEIFATEALRRILKTERAAAIGGVASARMKIIAWLTTNFNHHAMNMVQEYILEDVRNRTDLLFTWLYEEYSNYQGFGQLSDSLQRAGSDQYERVLSCVLSGLLERCEHKDREVLLVRIFNEAPLITDSAVSILKSFCQDESHVQVGISILKDLVTKRPTKQMDFLRVLLDLTGHDKSEVRNYAIKTIKQLHERGELKTSIEDHALLSLRLLLLPDPPPQLFGESLGRPEVVDHWSDEIARVCLHLYLVLLPINHKLVHDLAQVYVTTSPDIKRMILRVLENPVKGMGMDSPELLTLVESCPKGAETLVTRIIHILTDKAPPSAALVARVRDLYHKRVPDVRFLIPVLNGLTKKEVVAALPKLIKLNPVVVKEVFNRLLGGHNDSGAGYTNPLTPSELLVALHNIDSSKCDMKTIIKATSLCFGEKHIYTQEVLAVVMQQLMDQNPMPTLLMRTVLQSLSLYPRLIGFVMNILQRLILKQVWRQKKVWEGFIKCCQRTKPQSYQVLLQLPVAQLYNVFEICPELREPLLDHVNSFTMNQKAHVPQSIMDVLTGEWKPEKVTVKTEPMEVTVKVEPPADIPEAVSTSN
ncbi:hypothetical protein CHUAL_014111 [Chamberlinius hualienensis]